MKPAMIESVRIHGFRSLGDVELSRLPRATVLIGANGSGKSNFLRFLYMLNWMKGRRLGDLVERHGGADDYLYDGSEVTPSIDAAIGLRTNVGLSEYRFVLSHAQPDRFFFSKEAFRFVGATSSPDAPWQCLGSAHRESMIVEAAQSDRFEHEERDAARTIVSALKDLAPNQFDDIFTRLRKPIDIDDNTQLHIHGGNLAAILYRLEQEDVKRYDLICRQIGRILPIFDRFAIEKKYDRVSLRWRAKGIDKTFGSHLTSDGSLRFFALVTLLNLPPEMLPSIVLLDEPELGLHPAAISLVGGMIKSLAAERQVITATQSPLLVDAFGLDEIVVAELLEGRTEFRKLEAEQYRVWLDSFSTGELWQKNLLGGRP
jgi:predicted ATPase